MTNTVLYEIPDTFFPGYRVTNPFHAKVKYEYNNGKVKIIDVHLSATCLQVINVRGLVTRMERDIADAEKRRAGSLHPVMQQAIAPFIR